jgi:predicted nucleic-acid-binding protein
VSAIVLCETCWALRSYGYSRSEIAAAIGGVVDTALFEIQDRELVRRAMAQYRQGPADFADYLIGWQNRQAGCAETVTFDRALEGTTGFSLLSGSPA